MDVVPTAAEVAAADSIYDLARRLGSHCLRESGPLVQALRARDARDLLAWIEDKVAAIPVDSWIEAEEKADFAVLLADNGLQSALSDAELMAPLHHLAVLRGMLRHVLPFIFEAEEGNVPLDHGMPVPSAIRPMEDPSGMTPLPRTLADGHPLAGTGFSLFRHGAMEEVSVTLDFSHRERLDEITGSAAGALPKVGLVYPTFGTKNFSIAEINANWFFGVEPNDWDEALALDLLADLPDDVAVAVLPELCLPSAGALTAGLGADPGRYPPLVIAGSAHEDADGERRNSCSVYLDGEPVFCHDKCHAFRTGQLGTATFDPKLPEGITPGQKELHLLCGTSTRLGVVICADLNDELIPELLDDAGVNLLLVPSLSVSHGAFNGTLAWLASRRQGIGVIVNAGFEDGDGFHAVVGLPRAKPEEQTGNFTGPETDGPSLAYLDPAKPMAEAVVWLRP